MQQLPDIRSGLGYDVHAFAEGRKLIFVRRGDTSRKGASRTQRCRRCAPCACRCSARAAAMRDIGYHFPDNDQSYAGADSRVLLRRVVEIIGAEHYSVSNVDITIIAQAPKLSPCIEQMRRNVAEDLGVDIDRVSVKATTTERLGFTGRKRRNCRHGRL